MLVQFVKFETTLDRNGIEKVALDRFAEYEAIPGLVQKYYLKLDGENRYGGIMIWDSPESLARFRDSDLARTIGEAYKVTETPSVSIHQLMFPLRGKGAPRIAELTG